MQRETVASANEKEWKPSSIQYTNNNQLKYYRKVTPVTGAKTKSVNEKPKS